MLEAEPITVLDGDVYAGEAQIDRLRPGAERFVRPGWTPSFSSEVFLREIGTPLDRR
jgi:hypothetical protein